MPIQQGQFVEVRGRPWLVEAVNDREPVEMAGQTYHKHRAAFMGARNEGMTKIYNRLHDRSETAADIQRLRDLHAAMDRAVLEAYGSHDLVARAVPIFLDEANADDHTCQGRLFWPSTSWPKPRPPHRAQRRTPRRRSPPRHRHGG